MDFIKGADLSSLLEVERCGGLFRDGAAPEDALAIFRRYGVNWVRLRLWNDPYEIGRASCRERVLRLV